LRTLQHREEVMVGGMIGAIKLAHTRNPKPGAPSKYANFDLEDLEGVVRCILWPDGFADQGEMVKAESVVLIKGAVDRRSGDEANLIVNEIIPIEEAAHRFTTGLRIDIEESLHGEAVLPALDSILKGYQGTQTVVMVLRLASGDSVAIRNNKHRVEVVPELRARLDDLLGPNSHRLIAAKPERSGPPPKKKWQK
jgi:DNA polymerase-3 subunit alpha